MDRARYFELSSLICLSVLFWWRPLVADLHLALSSDAHTYILLIVPLSVALIYIGRKPLNSEVMPRRMFGVICLSGALLVRLLSGWNVFHLSTSSNLSIVIGALVIFWIGSVILCFGTTALQTHLFPLCFLFLVVPLPDHALAWVTEFLQQKSAWAAELLFRTVGIPVARGGVLLSIPGLELEVAQECSSIRSSTILIVITLLLAQLFLRTWTRKTALILAAVPLSVAKNAVRIFTIAVLGTRVDRGFLDGKLHHNGGVVFLSLSVIVIVALIWILRKSEKPPPAPMPSDVDIEST